MEKHFDVHCIVNVTLTKRIYRAFSFLSTAAFLAATVVSRARHFATKLI